MSLRQFRQEELEICENWFSLVETDDKWTDLGPVGEGESGAIRVQNGEGLLGAAKPGVPKTDQICRAAHEKIAFDLAHVLDLPIPAVVLWDRGESEAANRHLCISRWAFPQSAKWDVAESQCVITEASRVSAGPIVSAMRVYHTWISDTDRKSNHTQVNLDSSDGHLGVAFIDHAYSMSMSWTEPDSPVGACPKYMPAPEVPEVMVDTAARIADFQDSEINRIVQRIPTAYLPEPKQEIIIANLIARKLRLPGFLGI